MKNLLKIKNNLFRQYRQRGTPELEFKYKQYRNNLNRMLRIAEREHYDVLFSNYKGNLKKSWILLKEVINRNKTRDCSSKFLLNGECITDKSKIANGYNSYFVNVGPNLANNIPDTTISPLNNMNERNAFTFYINPTTETEIISLIKLLKNGSSGYDSISATTVQKTATVFITPLTHIMNLSLSSGIFPQELKIARVIPLFKSGDAMLFSNYRPVSVLPLFSKILERLM